MTRISSRRITHVAVLAALSAILYGTLEIPVFPPVYKLDFSTVPVMLAALWIGPWDSLVVLLFKDLTGLLHSSSMGVGELADFLCSAALVLSARGCMALIRRFLILRGREWKKAAEQDGIFLNTERVLGPGYLILSFVLSTVFMSAIGALTNYFIMFPFYCKLLNITNEGICGMFGVDSIGRVISAITVPFNLIKGAVICALAYLVYKAIQNVVPKNLLRY